MTRGAAVTFDPHQSSKHFCFVLLPQTGCWRIKQRQIPVFRGVQTWTVFEKPTTQLISFPLWKSEAALTFTLSFRPKPAFSIYILSQSSFSFARISHQLRLIPSVPVVQLQIEVLRLRPGSSCARNSRLWKSQDMSPSAGRVGRNRRPRRGPIGGTIGW